MKVIYEGDAPRHVPEAGLVARPGKAVEVPVDLGRRLVRLPDWKAARRPRTTSKRSS